MDTTSKESHGEYGTLSDSQSKSEFLSYISQHLCRVKTMRAERAFSYDLLNKVKTNIKNQSSIVVKYKKAWNHEDLELGGVPAHLRRQAVELLAKEQDCLSRELLPTWSDFRPGRIASWIEERPKLIGLDVEYRIDDTWWREMFLWVYNLDLEATRVEFEAVEARRWKGFAEDTRGLRSDKMIASLLAE